MMAHGYCLWWNPWLIAAHVVGNGAIILAYICIPLSLIVLARAIGILPAPVPLEDSVHRAQRWLAGTATAPTPRAALLWSAAFVFSCACTHVLDLIVIVTPAYWMQAAVLVLCGVISLVSSAKIAAFAETVAPTGGLE